MPRLLRPSYEGAWYHVMNRGSTRQIIFHEDSHREIFLDLLADVHDRFYAEIHAYCLMSNHYHLMIRTPLGNISRIMQHLDGLYTQRFNRSTGGDGPLFRGRFRSILADDDEYLIHLSRYIHLNPVSAKMVKEPEHYLWSSYSSYLYGTEQNWLSVDWVLDYFGSGADRAEKYRSFMTDGESRICEGGNPMDIKNIFEQKKQPMSSNKNSYLKLTALQKTVTCRSMTVSLKDIADCAAEFYGAPVEDAHLVRKKSGNVLRASVIYLAYQAGKYSFKQIADFILNISATSAQRTFRRFKIRLESNVQLKNDIDAICRVLERLRG